MTRSRYERVWTMRSESELQPALGHLGSAWSKDVDLWCRFWSKVDMRGPDECWNWVGGLGTSGSGLTKMGTFYMGMVNGKKKSVGSQRVAYMFAKNLDALPDSKLFVLTSCDNLLCHNPKHLSLGTDGQRMLLCRARGRMGCGKNARCGESHGGAVLDEQAVKNMRARHAQGESMSKLSRDYDLAVETVRKIVRRFSWKHVA